VTQQTKTALKGLTWIGSAPAVQLARTQVWEAAPTDLPVLLLGEPGTGRQLAAHILHTLSPRHQAPFIRVDCAAVHPSEMAAVLFEGTPILFRARGPRTAVQVRPPNSPALQPSRLGPPPGPRPAQSSALAQADGGTLFLDGIESLPVGVQQQLLSRLPRPSRIDTGSPAGIRIVTAAYTDQQSQARTGSFCAQLLYRLAIVPVRLPPLRRRGPDINLLATHFVQQARGRIGQPHQALSADVVNALQEHEWRGNVWELKRCCQQLALVPGNQPVTPERVGRLLQAAPWADGPQRKPVSRWTSPWQRSAGRN
jgi:DNA-binding NtrC family response regulator